MKKLFILLGAITYVINCLAANIYEGFMIGDLKYNLYSYLGSKTATVVYNVNGSYSPSAYTNEVYIIPETVEYNNELFDVTEIGPSAFSGYSTATPNGSTASKIVIPNTIKKIGESAFAGCRNITSMIIPHSVTTFDEPRNYYYCGTFYYCNNLRDIIYLSPQAPQNWTATTYTFVPDKQAYNSPKFTINNAKIIEMISFGDYDFYYTGQSPTTTWSNNVNGYTASLTMPILNGDVGSYEVWIPVIFTKGDESFTADVVYRYTVKPAKLTAKVNNVSREYGEENPQFSVSYSGFISGESESVLATQPTINTTATKTSNVGDYPITISGGNATNYEFVYEPGVLTVTKAPLSAKVNDATKAYGSSNPAFTIDYYGLKNNESAPAWNTRPTFQTNATQGSGVGQYPIKAVNGVPVNYDLGEITAGTLNITPAQLTIKANDAVRQYYSEDPKFSYTCNGFVNGENESVLSPTPTLSTTANLSSNVGTYEIKAANAANPNYSISYVSGTLTITPRTLIASVGNYERAYNEENPAFEVKYEGFVGTDDEKVLLSKPEAKTSATKTSDVGTYPISVTGGNADNYIFSYTNGVLTINKAEQTLSWEQDLTGLNVGDQIELSAAASSGLPVNYSMDATNAGEIYSVGIKKYLDCKANGSFQIVATQEGSNNYYSTARIRKNVVIGEGSTSINTTFDSSVQILPTSFGVRVMNAKEGELIKVYSTDGILQNSVKVEGPITDIPLSNNIFYIIKVEGITAKLSL